MEPLKELALWRQFDEARRHAFSDPAKALIARRNLQAIIDGTSEEEVRAKAGRKTHKGKRDLAQERRVEVEGWYRSHGFDITIPKPRASNRDFARWKKVGKALFYRPATAQMTYEAFMASVGQGDHWTVVNEAERAKIGWELAAKGYWFLAEVAPSCLRLNTSWNDLTGSIKLLSLEEYAIAYWLHRDLAATRIDVPTWCWLRTRYGQGALLAYDYDGGVDVSWGVASFLSVPCGNEGGRAVEVVEDAT